MFKTCKLKFILPCVQTVLTFVSVLVDRSVNQGHGEGINQVIANLLSNLEFLVKQALGYDDIVNYNFRIITVLIAVAFWFIAGLVTDKLIRRKSVTLLQSVHQKSRQPMQLAKPASSLIQQVLRGG
ncbi:MAG: hypothetical protein K0R57_699 [Paenibacillaceae bacterium]|jgi:flagellar biosynthesis/type III secretory pathway M-ring protein FliF/YscJ|nr:hypothetical protein [Paenibacillaceae bacterium]